MKAELNLDTRKDNSNISVDQFYVLFSIYKLSTRRLRVRSLGMLEILKSTLHMGEIRTDYHTYNIPFRYVS